MIKIVLACSAGMSTSLLMNKIKESAVKRNIEIEISAVAEATVSKHLEGTDIILLGPQVKHLEKTIKELVNGRIPVSIIPMQKYGLMDGEGVLNDILSILGIHKA